MTKEEIREWNVYRKDLSVYISLYIVECFNINIFSFAVSRLYCYFRKYV